MLLIVAGAVALAVPVCVAVLGRDNGAEDRLESEERRLVAAEAGDGKSGIRRSGPASMPTSMPVESVESRPTSAPVVSSGAKTITGVATNSAGEPVIGAVASSVLYFPNGEVNYELIAEHKGEAQSGDDGKFVIEVPGHGAYRVTVAHPDYAPFVKDKVRAGDALDVKLERGAAIKGRVRIEGSQKPAAEARLTLRRDKTTWSLQATADAEGRFELRGLFAGSLVVNVEHPNFVPLLDQTIELEGGATTEREFVLAPGKRIVGRIVADATKVPIANAVIACGQKKATTDDSGEFEFGGFAAESHSISIVADGFLTHWQQVNLSGSRDEAKLEILLRAGTSITGDVVDDTGKPLKGVEVKVFESQDDQYMWENGDTRYVTATDEEGRFTITGIGTRSWGGYRVRARKEGHADAYSKQIQVAEDGKSVDVHLVLSTGGTIAGVINDDAGKPVAGAKVSLTPASISEWSNQGRRSVNECITDATGTFSFKRLGESNYWVNSVARGYATAYKGDLKIVGPAVIDGVIIVMERGEPVRGKVTNEDGKPIPDANVTLQSRTSWANTVTNEAGEYEVTNVGAGPFQASAQAQGYSYERKKDIYPDKGTIDFELKRNGYVWGTVVHAETKQPIKGATIELLQSNDRSRGFGGWRGGYGSGAQTDRAGKFKLYARDGAYKLAVNAKGFITNETPNIQVSVSAQPEELTIEMVPGGAVEGWVTDNDGRPVGQVSVLYRQKVEGPAEYAEGGYTEADGYFYIGSMKEGMYDFAFLKHEQSPVSWEENVSVLAGNLPQVRARLAGSNPIEVFVLDDQDRPVEWCQALVQNQEGFTVGMTYARWIEGRSLFKPTSQKWYWSERQGQIRIRDLMPGTYKLVVHQDGFAPAEQTITVAAGGGSYSVKLERPKRNPAGAGQEK